MVAPILSAALSLPVGSVHAKFLRHYKKQRQSFPIGEAHGFPVPMAARDTKRDPRFRGRRGRLYSPTAGITKLEEAMFLGERVTGATVRYRQLITTAIVAGTTPYRPESTTPTVPLAAPQPTGTDGQDAA